MKFWGRNCSCPILWQTIYLMFYSRTTLHSILYLYTESLDRNEKGLPLPGFKSNRKCLTDHERSCGKNQPENIRLKSYNHGNVDRFGSELYRQFGRQYVTAHRSVYRATRGSDWLFTSCILNGSIFICLFQGDAIVANWKIKWFKLKTGSCCTLLYIKCPHLFYETRSKSQYPFLVLSISPTRNTVWNDWYVSPSFVFNDKSAFERKDSIRAIFHSCTSGSQLSWDLNK